MRKNVNIILVIITDNFHFLKDFCSHALYNHIALVTNNLTIYNNSNIVSLSFTLITKDIYNDELVIE